MGIAESKILAESLLSACHRAEEEGKDRLDETRFWKDVNFIKASKSIYGYIPPDIRGKSRQPAIKKAIARSSRQLKVPQVVQDLQDKRESLFTRHSATYSADGTHASPITSQSSPISSPIPLSISSLVDSYKLVIHYERQQYLGKIRLRLLYVSFFRLKDAIQPVNQYHYYDAATFIAQVIRDSGACGDSLDVVQRRVRHWIGLGERYSLLASDLGGLGALYILPDNGGESIWTKELPKSAKNANRIAMIENLRHQGLPKEAQNRDLHKSAEHEVATIWVPMKSSLDQVLEKQLSQTTYQTAAGGQPNRSDETGSPLQSSLPQLHRTIPGVSPSQIGMPTPTQTAPCVSIPLNAMRDMQVSSELVQDTRRQSDDRSNSHTSLDNQSEFMSQFRPREFTSGRIQPESIPCDTNVFQHGGLTVASDTQFSIAGDDQNDKPYSNPLDVMRPSIATITPADFPQAFALTSTMTPADYPQLFLYQQGSVTPADYPQMFPCDPSQYVGSSNSQSTMQSL